jgi:hypothetical protein
MAIWTASLPSNSAAQSTAQLRDLQSIAADLCKAPDMYGFRRDTSGRVSGQINAQLLSQRLAQLGIGGEIRNNQSSWQGIPQDKLSENLSDYRNCARQVFTTLLERFGPHVEPLTVFISPREQWLDTSAVTAEIWQKLSSVQIRVGDQVVLDGPLSEKLTSTKIQVSPNITYKIIFHGRIRVGNWVEQSNCITYLKFTSPGRYFPSANLTQHGNMGVDVEDCDISRD